MIFYRVFTGIACGRCDVRNAVGSRDIDALMNRGDIRRAGKGPHNARCAKIDKPPKMPNRGFMVFCAIFSPLITPTETSNPPDIGRSVRSLLDVLSSFYAAQD